MIRMDEINKIRKAFFVKGESCNSIAKKLNRSWDTVNRIVKMPREELENRGKRPNRKAPVKTPTVVRAIRELLEEEIEKRVKKKQKYTAATIYKKLTEQGIYHGSVRSMQDIVKSLREELKQTTQKSFLPLVFSLGSALQIDHGEVDVIINEDRYRAYLFVASVPGQAIRYTQVFACKSLEAWGEFHERAFCFFGGVFPQVIYDNDTVLVKKVLGDERRQTSFSVGMEEHYGFHSHFCNLAAGNEKGAVENGVGFCRRNFLPGLPRFASWDDLNTFLHSLSKKDIEENIHYKTQEKILDIFTKLTPLLSPLSKSKKWRKWLNCRVDCCQLITADHHQYSVPESFVGTYLRVALSVDQVEIFDKHELITSHVRQYGKADSLQLEHYLNQLLRKPNAFWHCKAVYQHKFESILMQIWQRLREKHDNKEANRQFVAILMLKRKFSEKQIREAIELALEYGAIEYAAVKNIIYQLEMPCNYFKQDNIKKLLPTSLSVSTWQFDLSLYAELSQEVFL